LEERIELLSEQRPRTAGVSIAIAVSLVAHLLLIAWLIRHWRPVAAAEHQEPIARYVQLMRQNPSEPQFTEAPGKKLEHPLNPNAPLSDGNRKAMMPEPTGDKPTNRPGDGGAVYQPRSRAGDGRQPSPAAAQPQPAQQQQTQQQQAAAQQPPPSQATAVNAAAFRQPTAAAASAAVDWRSAIKEVSKVASLGSGPQGIDLNGGGGDRGFTAENGPISFETQWYDWGDYAQSMVSRIRVNWYSQMPQIVYSGLKGVVTIRFTIHRDGRINEITILQSSGIPPYDFAAKKALELSSPLNPLPKDFPMDSEHVTAMFYYNLEPPNR
jgi:TonB family protein